jgi:hypothetical protein
MKEKITKRSLLLISCEEAYEICDKSQYGEASLWDKVKLNLRYTWCKFTQVYVKKNKKLTRTLKTANVQTLNDTERLLLINKFKKQLDNQV